MGQRQEISSSEDAVLPVVFLAEYAPTAGVAPLLRQLEQVKSLANQIGFSTALKFRVYSGSLPGGSICPAAARLLADVLEGATEIVLIASRSVLSPHKDVALWLEAELKAAGAIVLFADATPPDYCKATLPTKPHNIDRRPKHGTSASEHATRDYWTYISSHQWKFSAARTAELTASGHSCRLCDRAPPEVHLEVHHRSYANLGSELPRDLTTLCGECHRVVTGEMRRRRHDTSRVVAPQDTRVDPPRRLSASEWIDADVD